jgi:hypothetical protein
MHATVGDVLSAQMNSGTVTGRLWLGLHDPADLPTRLEQVTAAFTFEVEPEVEADVVSEPQSVGV